MPVDGGEHVVRATAPGKEPFATTVIVAKESDAQTVEIPILAAAPAAAVVPPPASSPPAPSALASMSSSVTPERTPSIRRTLAYVLGGAGLGQLVVAGYFGWRAFDKNRMSNDLCPTKDSCTSEGSSLSNQAGSAADVATVLTVTGIASVATGVYLLLTSTDKSAPVSSTESKLTFDLSPRGVTVGGRF